ncbi:MAG: chemotaxis protein CheW [Clostridium sp.]|nr:chemotaxis protein CheW [Clostridium sp.]
MNNSELKILVFTINGQSYATDISEVERILGYEKSTDLPDVPDFVDGIINYEDDVLPIISLAKRFNIKADSNLKEAKVIVTKYNGGKIGIIVNAVSEVKDIKDSDIKETPKIIGGISKRYIKGIINNDNSIVVMLDLSSILTEEEKALL